MGQQLKGGALAFIGATPIVFRVLEGIGLYPLGVDPLFLAYGVLLVLLGGGVYAEEIQFDQESGGKYEGLVLLYAILMIIALVGSVFISLA